MLINTPTGTARTGGLIYILKHCTFNPFYTKLANMQGFELIHRLFDKKRYIIYVGNSPTITSKYTKNTRANNFSQRHVSCLTFFSLFIFPFSHSRLQILRPWSCVYIHDQNKLLNRLRLSPTRILPLVLFSWETFPSGQPAQCWAGRVHYLVAPRTAPTLLSSPVGCSHPLVLLLFPTSLELCCLLPLFLQPYSLPDAAPPPPRYAASSRHLPTRDAQGAATHGRHSCDQPEEKLEPPAGGAATRKKKSCNRGTRELQRRRGDATVLEPAEGDAGTSMS